MQSVKVFTLGKAQAVRIPVRYRFDVDEVEVFKRGNELVLRPKATTGADLFERLRAKHGALDVDFRRKLSRVFHRKVSHRFVLQVSSDRG